MALKIGGGDLQNSRGKDCFFFFFFGGHKLKTQLQRVIGRFLSRARRYDVLCQSVFFDNLPHSLAKFGELPIELIVKYGYSTMIYPLTPLLVN